MENEKGKIVAPIWTGICYIIILIISKTEILELLYIAIFMNVLLSIFDIIMIF